MGLSGRKQKQRIPHDPRNLSWADDANKFGAAYLQKLGWSAGTGLGASGDGRTTHIKVQHKLDMLGIGAAHQQDPNGLAWKQNKDFENLLRRLNAGGEGSEEVEMSKIDGFAKATEVVEEDAGVEGVATEEKESKKKRKRDKEEDGADGRKKKSKKSKGDSGEEEKKDKKKKKKSKSENSEDEDTTEQPTVNREPSPEPVKPVAVIARPHRAHRARFLASKRLASKSSVAIDEILGISRSASATPYPSESIPSTPLDSTPAESNEGMNLEKLTTSTKCVMDYFKEKLLAKSSGSSTPFASTSTSTLTPRNEDAEGEEDAYDDRPRGGLGLGFSRGAFGLGSAGGIGGSKLRSTVTFAEAEESSRIGLGMFSKLSSMFTSTTSTSTSQVEEELTVEETVTVEATDGLIEDVKEEKRKKDKKSRKNGSGEEAVVEEEMEDVVEKKSKKDRKRRKGSDELSERVEETSEDSRSSKKKRKEKVEDDGYTQPVVLEDAEEKLSKKEKKSKRKAEAATPQAEEVEASKEKKKKKDKSSKRKSRENN
ncbi:hypothetical protein BDY19DRAFT_1040795 [Irpex rosettiformis]|uniref:Uncharacterized protein n=1 Tax=Irpex rosettiformis TaxID=378272 RepID=A0ACB8U8H4_9APHY|nr:hypothetical protein BDY19DRAFT_1040795 [Irpex rosettiformis]